MGGYVCGSRDLIDFLYRPRAAISFFHFASARFGCGVPSCFHFAGFA